ncbi:unnamed protein product [Closterium sp. Naga37s-1]|nr:unnamed protein product [Closterium sp. Naga37s-1]
MCNEPPLICFPFSINAQTCLPAPLLTTALQPHDQQQLLWLSPIVSGTALTPPAAVSRPPCVHATLHHPPNPFPLHILLSPASVCSAPCAPRCFSTLPLLLCHSATNLSALAPATTTAHPVCSVRSSTCAHGAGISASTASQGPSHSPSPSSRAFPFCQCNSSNTSLALCLTIFSIFLPFLSVLETDLSANSFSGVLPEAITALTALQHMYSALPFHRMLRAKAHHPSTILFLIRFSLSFTCPLSGAVKNTSLICPSTDAACDVPQTLLSPFCIQCPNFCRHCIQYGSQPSYFPEKPLPPPSPAAPPLPPMGRPINRPQLVTTTTVSSSKGGLSGGAIAAIVIGLLIVLITAAGLAYIVITHKADSPDQQGSFRPSTCIFSYGVYPFDAAV